jgi:hypothetical protein
VLRHHKALAIRPCDDVQDVAEPAGHLRERDLAMILLNASEGKSRQLSAKGWRLSRWLVVSGAEPPLFAYDGISNLVAAPHLAVRRDPALGLLHVGLNMASAGPLLDF